MARPTRGTAHIYEYVNDRGDIYNVALLDYIADAGGFNTTSDAARGGLPGHAKMRHVGLVDASTGKHFSQPIADEGQAIWNNGGDLTVSGTSYHATGRIGEHWPFAHV